MGRYVSFNPRTTCAPFWGLRQRKFTQTVDASLFTMLDDRCQGVQLAFTSKVHDPLPSATCSAVTFLTASLSSRLWKPSQQNGVLARPNIQSLAADLQCYILSPGCCGTQTIHEFPSWCTSKMSCPLRSPKEPPCKPKRGHTKDAKSNFKTKAQKRSFHAAGRSPSPKK